MQQGPDITIAIIGGTGLSQLEGFVLTDSLEIDTPYGKPSAAILSGVLGDKTICFLARHGQPHRIPPHRINYQANLWALHTLGVQQIIAVNAVGGITQHMTASHINIPDQVIDYTYRRNGSFCDDDSAMPLHIDFSYPFDEHMRSVLINKAKQLNLDFSVGGVYGCTEGPRLETAAEIKRMAQDGCDVVGMTLMPEAALARELGIAYVSVCVIANKAAGCSEGVITMEEIEKALHLGMARTHQLLKAALPEL